MCPEDVRKCLEVIVANKDIDAVRYAVKYALLGLTSKNHESLKIYCLNVLKNIDRWNGKKAYYVRKIVRNYVNQDKELTKVKFVIMKDYRR